MNWCNKILENSKQEFLYLNYNGITYYVSMFEDEITQNNGNFKISGLLHIIFVNRNFN